LYQGADDTTPDLYQEDVRLVNWIPLVHSTAAGSNPPDSGLTRKHFSREVRATTLEKRALKMSVVRFVPVTADVTADIHGLANILSFSEKEGSRGTVRKEWAL